jgi:Lar family restriction alleviation protein
MECPFCGGTATELIDLGATFWLSCTACGANGPSGDSAEQALEYWNWAGTFTE